MNILFWSETTENSAVVAPISQYWTRTPPLVLSLSLVHTVPCSAVFSCVCACVSRSGFLSHLFSTSATARIRTYRHTHTKRRKKGKKKNDLTRKNRWSRRWRHLGRWTRWEEKRQEEERKIIIKIRREAAGCFLVFWFITTVCYVQSGLTAKRS